MAKLLNFRVNEGRNEGRKESLDNHWETKELFAIETRTIFIIIFVISDSMLFYFVYISLVQYNIYICHFWRDSFVTIYYYNEVNNLCLGIGIKSFLCFGNWY